MKIYLSKSHSPYMNQSIEYNLLKEKGDEDILLLWLNENAIIIGRNQNIFNEINEEFVKEKGIKVARRHSGGGAVYHDMGNILFSLMTKKDKRTSYEEFLKPIIGFLNQQGVNAAFHGRNDVLVDGMKISGNAQFVLDENLATHGTLLFNTDLTVLNKALLTNKHKIEAKGIQSNRMRVTNIKNHISSNINSEEFVNELIKYFVANGNGELCEIPQNIIEKSTEMVKEMETFEWIYGKSPIAKITNKVKYPGGNISVFLDVISGKISNLQIYGDFLSIKDVQEVCQLLDGKKFVKEEICNVLNEVDLHDYFGTITSEEITKIIIGE
ncbi:lipoate--protein ligase [Mycoplasma todarodis]|uniref:lipoate--protein ligase n=1 Tax=Mycoplasma todarodis TaxID=1937191 RepID=A0A4R0XQ02_9MOLU|nr:lipoate--protein ligase [Mycoplasma todarodis]TCG10955.1 lipoyltransferase [Mycoplasma todarodis]